MRKRLFMLSCAAEGISSAEFARRIGVTRSVLSSVLAGRAASRRVTAEVDRFIAHALPKIKNQIKTAA